MNEIKIKKIITKVIDNRGKTPPLSERGVPLIEVNAISESSAYANIQVSRKFVTEDTYKTWFRNGHPEKNDILMPTVGTVGNFGLFGNYKACIAQNIVGLKVNREIYDPVYLSYLFSSNSTKKEIFKILMGAVQPSLKVPQFLDIKVQVHEQLEEQKKIAKILSSVDEVIELAEKEISKLQDLKKGMMQELLTIGIGHTKFKDSPIGRIPESWKVKQLGDLFSFKNGVNAGKESYGKGIKFINISEILSKSFMEYKDIPGQVDISDKEIENNLVEKGDILFNRTSETPEELGMTSVYLSDDPVVFGGFVIRGKPLNDYLDLNFKRYCFHSNSLRGQTVNLGQGAVRANIGQESLSKILMAVPPLDEQKSIAKVLVGIDDSIFEKSKVLRAKKLLKKGIMQDLLTGKVRVDV